MSTPELRDPRKEFGAAVFAQAQENPAVVALSADSGNSSGFGDLQKAYPERYLEFGIMEQCVIGVASGLATTGKIPVFCAIAPFVTAHAYETVRNDLGYMRQNVKLCGRNGGITYSDLGSTHHSLEDFAIMRMIPDMVVLAPQDPGEIKGAVAAMIGHRGPVYMRIGNEPVPMLFPEGPFEIGKGRILRDGKDVAVISTGAVTGSVLAAVQELAEKGVDPMVIGMPTVCPVDEALIAHAAAKTGRIVTVEEHYVPGGLGSAVSEVCAADCPVRIRMLGIPKTYASVGPYRQLLAYYGLDAAGIAGSVLEFVRN